MDWRHRAICRDEDPELFFPIGNTGPALLQIEQAKAVCRRCPVIQDCLAWALESGQDAGVWGGLSEDERRALKRRNARARRPSRFSGCPHSVLPGGAFVRDVGPGAPHEPAR
jgi:WhiB family redox-sensing transcriptional regulator